jgi:myo-inositol-1(or 4)-monophosphatase
MLNTTQTTQIKKYLITLGAFAEEQKKGKLSSSIKFSDARNIVTNIDLEVQTKLVEELKKITPDWNFLGEEDASIKNNRREYTWIIDPIDGTLNYLKDLSYYSISLGLLKNNEFVAGFIYAPGLSQLYSAVKGEGAFLNDIPLHTDQITEEITYWCRECEPKQGL